MHAQPRFAHVVCCERGKAPLLFLFLQVSTWVVCNFFGIILVYSPISSQQMAVHRLTTVSPPTTPRRSPRLPTRKRARASDSEQQLPPSSSKLPLNPDPSPRCIRAQKRQKILDGSSRASPPLPAAAPIIDNSITRAGKRKSLIPHDHHESDSHHRVPKKKRKKENIVNDALTANATSSSLKISMTLDTRQGAGNNVCSCLFLFSISFNNSFIGMKRTLANRNRSGTQGRSQPFRSLTPSQNPSLSCTSRQQRCLQIPHVIRPLPRG